MCLVEGVQGNKVTMVILRRPRRLVEADRRHGAPVEAAEVRDVDLGAAPLHRQRGDVRVAPADWRGANRPPRPRRPRRLNQIRRAIPGVLRGVGTGAAGAGTAWATQAPARAEAGRGLLGLVAERRAAGRPVVVHVDVVGDGLGFRRDAAAELGARRPVWSSTPLKRRPRVLLSMTLRAAAVSDEIQLPRRLPGFAESLSPVYATGAILSCP